MVQVQTSTPPAPTITHETIYIKSEQSQPSISIPSTSTAIVLDASAVLDENQIIVGDIKHEQELQISNQADLTVLTNSDEMTLNRLNTSETSEVEMATTDSNDLKMEFDTNVATG